MNNYTTMDKDIVKKIKEWNPMQEDYDNFQFNKYCSGPGEDLSLGMPSTRNLNANNHRSEKRGSDSLYLVFFNLPLQMTKNALFNMCSRHGMVTKVSESNKTRTFFVHFANISDMEATYRALEKSTYNFSMIIGQRKGAHSENFIHNSSAIEAEPRRENEVDFKSRTFQVSSKQYARPYVNPNPPVTESEYRSNPSLQRNDPQKICLIEQDAHRLEQAGLGPQFEKVQNSNRNYQTGRAYVELPEELEKNIKEKSKLSEGDYDPVARDYRHLGHAGEVMANCGNCVACKKLCDFICFRCEEYFCGRECCTIWEEHRYICGKNKLRKINPLSKEGTTSMPPWKKNSPSVRMPRSGDGVMITAVVKSNVVFVRSKMQDQKLLHFKMVSSVQLEGKDLRPLSEPPQCGQYVIALFHGQYNRAMVLNTTNPKEIHLVYIDYGNLDTKPWDELLAAKAHHYSQPRLAFPVILKGVPDVYMTDDLRDFMYSQFENSNLQIKYNDGDATSDGSIHEVQLIDKATNYNINKVIVVMTTPVEPQNSDDPFYYHFLKRYSLPEGNDKELVVMDNSLLTTRCISCATKEYACEIQKFQESLQSYAESLKPQHNAPRVDELCLARYSVDQKWYRGRCLELVGDGFPTIVFIDYGNVTTVNVKDIRRYPSQFKFPIFTSDCEIQGLPNDLDDKLVTKLEELIPNGSILKCDHIEALDKDFYVIKVNGVLQKRINAELLTADEQI